MDETWISYYTLETKVKSKQWVPCGRNAPIKAKTSKSIKKVMVIPFFDAKGLIYTHYVKEKHTVNAAYFIEVVRTFLLHLSKKRPEMMAGEWFLHMDNCLLYTSPSPRDS